QQYLTEVSEYMDEVKQHNEEIMRHIMDMVSTNIFRPLPPPVFNDFDPDEDEPNYDPAWPHMQLVYAIFHKSVVTVDAKLIRKCINKKFLLRLINLFNSEDPRERECLKMILHRIYGRCMPVRFFVRNAINNVLFLVIHENRRHNGIAELLDILGSIINGFALPLKSEHVCFLQQVLVPLHKTPTLSQFHLQLNYCVTQFILKDPTLAGCVLSGILKYWPVTSCQKELLFLEELEGVLALADPTLIEKVVVCLTHTYMNHCFKRVSNAISSHHFQVAEKALFLWNNDTIASFTSNHKDRILPIIFPALQQNYSTHWNSTVSSLTLNIIRIFKEMDKELYEGVSKEFKTQRTAQGRKMEKTSRKNCDGLKKKKNNKKTKTKQKHHKTTQRNTL
ncbi:hypothetical protein RFI_04996, partial [Reticulomyxa filosa]